MIDWIKKHPNLAAALGITGGCVAIGVAIYLNWPHPAPAGGESVIAPSAPVLKKAPIVPVLIKAPIKTYQGETKANLKLPPLVIANPDKQVISATAILSNTHPQTVTTVLDTETGDVKTYTKTDDYPWLAVETRGEAGIMYGYKFKSSELGAKPIGRFQVKYDVLRIKALTVGATASLDTDRDGFVGLGVSYKW